MTYNIPYLVFLEKKTWNCNFSPFHNKDLHKHLHKHLQKKHCYTSIFTDCIMAICSNY